LRTQQVIAHESGVTDTIDPLGGSWYVESLTGELEKKTREYPEKIDDLDASRA
jgi:methylmalonyl-CoA mutase N-terminal domain/subunit